MQRKQRTSSGPGEQLRIVNTPAGPIQYTLSHKQVKNWNLRVREGQVYLSVPLRVSREQADAFVHSRGEWLARVLERQNSRESVQMPELPPRDECMSRLSRAVARVFPLAAQLGVKPPQLRLRRMKSQWGNCHYRQGYITLNTVLAACPEPLQDYVALHELVHFLHPDHGAGFRRTMDTLMPDWKQRRIALKGYRLE